VLIGPRRVGKSVEIKRAISNALANGTIPPRRVIHAACNDWRARDLGLLSTLADSLSPPSNGPRYFFLDEITAIADDWVGRVAWLRDNTAMGDDCVVLSGSNTERFEQARSDLADRRGPISDSIRTLLPMGFRSFARVCGVTVPDVPTIHPRDMLGSIAADAVDQLRPFHADLLAAWEQYLQVGGMPRAVSDWLQERAISQSFVNAIWDAIHGDALQGGDWTPIDSQSLLELLALRISAPINKSDLRRELGGIHHDVLDLRFARLQNAFVTWPCYRAKDGRPDRGLQNKLYFIDPLHARLAHLRKPTSVRPPDFTKLTEQQLGVELQRARERDEPGTWTDADTVFYYRSPTNSEVDFTGPWLGGLPYEGKYTEGTWLREAQTAMTAFGKCVLATRSVLERKDNRFAIPTGILAYLIDEASV
jgi:predicted AAA+ superfamily ATPase